MAIEYLRPEDSYNIDVFNRNFQAVEAAVKGIRPLDWINLSDISQEKDPAVVALLHIPATYSSRKIFGQLGGWERLGRAHLYRHV